MGFFQTMPLGCDEGTIKINFNDRADLTRAGYFSTTLYYRSTTVPFTETDYYYGIKIYTQIINERRYFKNVGFIIYTDAATYPLLQKHFGAIPKVIIAIVQWPRYSVRKGVIENTILRCLRFQAKVLFPSAWIAVRDADTIFAYEINNALIKKVSTYLPNDYYSGLKTDIIYRSNVEDILETLADEIGYWEATFIRIWLRAGDKIVLSTSDQYRATWHKEMPYTYAARPFITDPSILNKDYIYVTQRDHIRKLLEEGRSTFGVIFDAPKGVYAGFSHLAADAPADFWRVCCKYLTSHYKLITSSIKEKKIISNTYSSIGAIGKDERMILFGAMPQFFDDMYFVHLDYYGGLEFKEAIFSPSRHRPPVLEHERIDSVFISIPDPSIDKVTRDRTKDEKIGGTTFQSLLLSPDYAHKLYTLPYVFKYETADRFVLSEDGTMNEHFKHLFSNMLDDFAFFKRAALEVGKDQLEKFGAPITRNEKDIVPSLQNLAYGPIRLITNNTRKYVAIRKNDEPPNNARSRRALERARAVTKKERRRPRGSNSGNRNTAIVTPSASNSD